jgi:TfoX/Sxy family transcriptional regulator of competence genes
MTSEDKLAAEVRAQLASAGTIREVKMFGGVGFMLDGNMVAAVSKRGLLLRVGKDRHHHALEQPGARPMEMRGRVMEGYVRVDPAALDRKSLKAWLDEALAFVRALPAKAASGKSSRKGARK